MSTYFLATPVVPPPPPPPAPPTPIPTITLESMNGLRHIVLDGQTGWIRMPGATGLEMPPFETVASTIPGVYGAVVQDVRVEPRPVFIPIYCGSDAGSHLTFLQMKDTLRSIVDPMTGYFKIVGKTIRGERELIVHYEGGLEGMDGADQEGMSWCKIGLTATAYDPFARDREERSVEFRTAGVPTPFLGVVGGTDAPWPRQLSSTAVIGNGMEVYIDSEVPVYPTVTLSGPMDSFEGSLSPTVVQEDGTVLILSEQQWLVVIPLGVPAGSLLKMVTDPRQRSVRLDGALAAGRVALGSALRPFYPGLNTLNVAAPNATEDTLITISWRELHRSLW